MIFPEISGEERRNMVRAYRDEIRDAIFIIGNGILLFIIGLVIGLVM